jgi:hypothetical protein
MQSVSGTDVKAPFTVTLANIGKPAVATVVILSASLNFKTPPFNKVGTVRKFNI